MTSKFRITGDISIVPCSILQAPCHNILLMGCTGSGKSTFIEALAGSGGAESLGISKDQLDGFTQEVSAYELRGVKYTYSDWVCTVYLIDSPGFADSKIPEMEVISKVKQWIYDQNFYSVDSLFYLCPITDTRIPGSKRRTISMLQSLLPTDSAPRVTIVTTMWDTICNPQAKLRAEAHFEQLKNEIWNKFLDEGAKIDRFNNDESSALHIIKDLLHRCTKDHPDPPLCHPAIVASDPSAPFLYQELLDRMDSARQAKQMFRLERIQLIAHPNPELESFVVPKLKEAKEDLAKFLSQVLAFGNPPVGFKIVPNHLVYHDLLEHVNDAQEDQVVLRLALRRIQEGSQSDPIRELALQTQIKEVNGELVRYAAKLIEFGSPPKGFDMVILPSHVLNLKNRVRQRMYQEKKNLFTKLKKG